MRNVTKNPDDLIERAMEKRDKLSFFVGLDASKSAFLIFGRQNFRVAVSGAGTLITPNINETVADRRSKEDGRSKEVAHA